jgi:hypothetical protein
MKPIATFVHAAFFSALVLSAANAQAPSAANPLTTAPSASSAAARAGLDVPGPVPTDKQNMSDANLKVLREFMQGRYDSKAQAEADKDFLHISLVMVPIWPERTDGCWSYVEQAAANTLDRPYRQRVYRLTKEGNDYVSWTYEFESEPLKHAGAFRQEKPLSDVKPEQLRLRKGCEVYMQRNAEGAFVGGSRGNNCFTDWRGTKGYATAKVTVTRDKLNSWDQGYNTSGEQIWGSKKGAYEFVKTSQVVSKMDGKSAGYDLTQWTDQVEAFAKIRASLDGKDAYADWEVMVFIVEPGKRAMPVMRLDGFNVGRMLKQPDGSWQFLSREIAYYRDLQSGKILDKWTNPITGQVNDVLHVINDPVNQSFPATPTPRFQLPWNVRGEDVFIKLDIPLAYPNPLQPADFPEESSGATYFASEHFLYFAKTADVMNRSLASAPTQYAWTRTGPWLPWMKMGQRPGYILYSGQGKKLKSAAELDRVVREYTEKNYPDFMVSPKAWTQPNETSWTYYRKMRGGDKAKSGPAGHSVLPKDAPPAEAKK